MVNQELRDYIAEGNPDAVVFDNPAFDNSIIGTDSASGCVVYDLELMIQELALDDGMSYEEAMEFIDYNTMRTLPYISSEGRPIILERGFVSDFVNDFISESCPVEEETENGD